MEVEKSLFIILLVVAIGVHSLSCWDGDLNSANKKKCQDDVEFCVLWWDHILSDTYVYCDDSNLCKEEGITNTTLFVWSCCKTDYCNAIRPEPTAPPSLSDFKNEFIRSKFVKSQHQ